MTNAEISKKFYEIAELLAIQNANPFRVRAYERAAQTIETYSQEVGEVYASGGVNALRKIPGIGEELALKIEELQRTGRLKFLVELEKKVPKGLLEVMQVEGMGPKRTQQVWGEFGVRSVANLEKLLRSGKLVGVAGWKDKMVEKVLHGIQVRSRMSERRPIYQVWPTAQEMVTGLRKSNWCQQIEVAGSLRRRKDTIGDIDLVASSTQPKKVMQAFAKLLQIQRLTAAGPTKSHAVLKIGVECDLRVVKPNQFGAALYYSTGSKKHNVRTRQLGLKRGVTVNEYGVHKGTAARKQRLLAARTETEVFQALGLPYIPPELREDTGEIEAAQAGKLPRLIELTDIQGDLHIHSNLSDGQASMTDMARAANKAGLKYLAFTDHASSMGMVRGLKTGNLAQYLKRINAARKAVPGLHILSGVEVDIQADGSLYLPDRVLKQLDWVVASVHSHFKQTSAQMTKRLLAAIKNPNVKVIGHPTTRKLGEREQIEFDVEAVFKAAKHYGVAMELDGAPERLDLPDYLLKRAKELGVRLVIDTDAHHTQHVDFEYAVGQARRGWLEKRDVLNCLPWSKFQDML